MLQGGFGHGRQFSFRQSGLGSLHGLAWRWSSSRFRRKRRQFLDERGDLRERLPRAIGGDHQFQLLDGFSQRIKALFREGGFAVKDGAEEIFGLVGESFGGPEPHDAANAFQRMKTAQK